MMEHRSMEHRSLHTPTLPIGATREDRTSTLRSSVSTIVESIRWVLSKQSTHPPPPPGLDPEVSLPTCPSDVNLTLSGVGRHWRSIVAREEDYEKSITLEYLDDFLSHDWATPWYAKLLALYYCYNWTPAVLSGCLVAFLGHLTHFLLDSINHSHGPQEEGGIEQKYKMGLWPVWMGSVTFLIVLFFRQRLMLSPQKCVFLDKLCIHQTNDALKKQGILGLGAFLRRSQRLVVLWSPRYFTRLWCTYELATWYHLGRDFRKTVHFVPVGFACAIVFASIFSVTFFSLDIFILAGSGGNLIIPSILFGFFVMQTHIFRCYSQDLKLMAPQLARFSVKHADCYCCSVQHRDPRTGLRLMCDRLLVCSTLKSWFGDQDQQGHIGCTSTTDFCPWDEQDREEESSGLEKFDEAVRSNLFVMCDRILDDYASYDKVLLLCIPSLWSGLDAVAGNLYMDTDEGFKQLLYSLGVWLFILPCVYAAVLSFAFTYTAALGEDALLMPMELLRSLVVSLPGFVIFSVLWLTTARVAKARPAHQLVWYVLLLMVTTVAYSRGLQRMLRMTLKKRFIRLPTRRELT
eukprot:TRINITY_DN41296_c0_g1_i1.p1 TRINITY_DN41296_c0_g1~~TRINITY_DN41296_c0_g1_i1.p1  ORF type:complete len:574 (-),score=65.26 TRINITY_DN41296_c0_g1_i1:193-1914(-)